MPDIPAAFADDTRLSLGTDALPPPVEMVVAAPVASLKDAPELDLPLATTLLHGEMVDVYRNENGWAWGQAQADGYVGYIPAAMLADPDTVPTHTVTMPMTHLYAAPTIKAVPVGMLMMNSRITVTGTDGVFLLLSSGFYIQSTHVAPLDTPAEDWVAVAEMFLHAPYLWGGNSVQGVDCSGLIQIAMARAGRQILRDTDMQEATLGDPVDPDGPLQRGDVLFWKGHTGVMIDSNTLLHATEYTLRVLREPVTETRARLEKLNLPVTSVRRPG